MVYRITYCSRNVIDGSPQEVGAEIQSLLLRSRMINREQYITGALLFNGEAFAQVLEGSHKAVEGLYTKICKDPRHRNIVLLEAVDSPERCFANWAMAYSGPEAKKSDLYTRLKLDECQADPHGVGQEILQLLKKVVNAHA
jgi:hypothetical protein